MKPIVEFKNITKSYPGVIANKNISFSIEPNSIHAILGENGAGKSTLVKILYGHVNQDQGNIYIDSKNVKITSPSVAKKLGINMVFQHFSLFESLTVAENLILGIDKKLSMSELIEKSQSISSKYGFNLNLNSPVSSLSVGQRQSVEIVRSLLNDPKILILDEPTSVLTPDEIKNLFKIISNLVQDNLTVIFISHKLEEIINLSNRVTILRGGEVVDTLITKNENPDSLGLKMLGYKITKLKRNKVEDNSKVLFSLNNVSTFNQDPFSVNLNNINLNVDLSLARGLSYYTGTIIEVSSPEEFNIGSIGGGGRYDDLVQKNNPRLSGFGISFGFDRIFLVLEELNLFPKTLQNQSHFLFLNFGDKSAEFSFKKLSEIRDREISCEFYPNEVKLKKQMNYADQRSIPFVIMIGQEEIKNNIFIVKDMRTGDQSKHSISSIITILEKLSQSV